LDIRIKINLDSKITRMEPASKQILLTNDDGIESPGLWAAAEALSPLGFVTVAAPRNQSSGAGRSHPLQSDGRITPSQLQIGHQIWTAYAIGGSPAQAVMFALLDLLPSLPDLVVSGINYGENVGNAITISGTIGAALEGAGFGVPALAVSLQLTDSGYLGYSRETKFNVAGHFTHYFAERMLAGNLPADVNVLKVDVPANATVETPWQMARLGGHRYFIPHSRRKDLADAPGPATYDIEVSPDEVSQDSDIYVMRFEKKVAVTPLSLDMTSRVSMDELDHLLRKG
jgi:5'-nucleotidase